MLSRNQQRALTALLTEATVSAAAHRCGLSEATLYRYQRDPSFRAALTEAQGSLLAVATARLAGLLGAALDVLGLDLQGHDARFRLDAARVVLAHYPRLAALGSFEERLAVLEQRLGEGR